MTDKDKKAFAALMYPFSKIYDLGMEDKFIMQVWFEVLADHDINAITVAVQRYLKSTDAGVYKPKPADLLKMIEGTSVDKAFAAWTKVESAARRVGTYRTVAFDDPIIHRTIDDMGGWVRICQSREDELPFVAKEFQSRYKGWSSRREIPPHSTRLYGLIDQQNAADGYQNEETPVLIGDQQEAKRLLEGGCQPESVLFNLLPN